MKAFAALLFVLFAGASIIAFSMFKQNFELKKQIAELQSQVTSTHNDVARAAELESLLGKANAEIERMKNTLPAHTPAK